MDPADYITDLEGESRTLRDRVAELEEELRKVREELRVARERKIEEVTVPLDSIWEVQMVTNAPLPRLVWTYRLTRVFRWMRSAKGTVLRKKKPPALAWVLERLNTNLNQRLTTGTNSPPMRPCPSLSAEGRPCSHNKNPAHLTRRATTTT